MGTSRTRPIQAKVSPIKALVTWKEPHRSITLVGQCPSRHPCGRSPVGVCNRIRPPRRPCLRPALTPRRTAVPSRKYSWSRMEAQSCASVNSHSPKKIFREILLWTVEVDGDCVMSCKIYQQFSMNSLLQFYYFFISVSSVLLLLLLSTNMIV